MRTSTLRTVISAAAGLAIGALVLSGCSSTNDETSEPKASSAATSAACPDPEAGANRQDTASYRFVMSSSEPEEMVTQEEVDSKGLTEGELVVGDMGMSSDSDANRHVEVAICDLTTGKTVQGADVGMKIVSNGHARPMMTMEMRGLDEPATESHYGNNTVVPTSAYKVRVTLNGETAEFPMAAAK